MNLFKKGVWLPTIWPNTRLIQLHNKIQAFFFFVGITGCHINLVPRVFHGELKDPGNEDEGHILYI